MPTDENPKQKENLQDAVEDTVSIAPPSEPDSGSKAKKEVIIKQPEEEKILVPQTDINAPLNIEELKKADKNVPVSDMNAPLKVEQSQEQIEDVQAKSNKVVFVVGSLGGFLIIASALAFYFFLVKNPSGEVEDLSLQEEIAEKQKESASPSAVMFERSEWPLEVLNGSGVVGFAKKSADKLKESGYKIVKVGNASGDYEETEIYVSESKKEGEKDQLLKDLQKQFKSAKIGGVLKETDSTASARIIIGSLDGED